jgi:hypothetical protein
MLPGVRGLLSIGRRRTGTLWCALVLLAAPGFAEFQFRFDAGQRLWTLSNGWLEAVFQLTPADTFQFVRLAGPAR